MGKFDDVKVGDYVKYWIGSSYWREEVVCSVIRITKSEFVTEGNVRIRKSDGKLKGSHSNAEHATEDDVRRFKHGKHIAELRVEIRSYLNASLETMSADMIEELYDFLLKQKKDGKKQQNEQTGKD